MKKPIFCIKSKEGTFTFKYPNDGGETQRSISELFTVFGDKEKNKHCYVMTAELKERASRYALQKSIEFPLFHKFRFFIDSIPIGNSFIILDEAPRNLDDLMYFNFLIETSNEVKDERDIECLIESKIENLPKNINVIIENYNAELFNQSKTSRIGEPNKHIRTCRFCLRTMALGATFKHKAHAISEALGNKNIYINEECDDCNDRFGSSIETELLTYFDLFRALAGLKGKKGYRKIEFDECSLSNDGNILSMEIKEGYDDIFNKSSEKHRVKLTYNHRVTTVNLYKALCKYALSTIPNEELPNFKKTVRWLNGDVEIKNLPSVFTSLSISTISDDNTPQIMLYFRKKNDLSYPYLVVELNLNANRTIFVVPACKKDDRDFKSKIDRDLVKNTFCINGIEWEEKEYDNYNVANISQGYLLDVTPMDKPLEGYE